MRKSLMMMTVLAGAAAATGAHAAPAAVALPGAALDVASQALTDGALVQPVQYYEDWRYREFRRHEAFERFRRHEEWRRFHQAREGYGGWGGGYGRGYGGYYR